MKLNFATWEQTGARGRVYRRVRVRGKWTPVVRRVR